VLVNALPVEAVLDTVAVAELDPVGVPLSLPEVRVTLSANATLNVGTPSASNVAPNVLQTYVSL
jgi:hypothetical protein